MLRRYCSDPKPSARRGRQSAQSSAHGRAGRVGSARMAPGTHTAQRTHTTAVCRLAELWAAANDASAALSVGRCIGRQCMRHKDRNRGEQDVVDGCWFPLSLSLSLSLCAHAAAAAAAATLMPNLVPLVDNRPDRSGAGCTIEQVGATLSATAEGIMSIRIRRSLCRHPCMHCMPMHAHVCLCSAHACMSMIYAYAPRSQCSACGCARPR